MDELQSWWQVPSIAYFCSLFKEAFGLPHFDIDELESALLETNEALVSPLLVRLLVCLLGGCYHRCDINCNNYGPFLKDIVKYRWHLEDQKRNLLEDDQSTFGSLSLKDRVDVLLAICHYRLTADDVEVLLQNIRGDDLRLQPLGRDAFGATYWYFYGTRLYKEDRCPRGSRGVEKNSRDSGTSSKSDGDGSVEICSADKRTACSSSTKSACKKRSGAKIRYPMLRRHRTLGKFGKQKRDVIGMADKKSQKFKPRKLGIGEEIHSADNTAENFQMYTRSSVKRMKYSNDNSDSELKIIGDAEDSQQVNKQEHYQRRSNRLKNLSVDNPQFADSLNRNCFSKGRKRLHQKASEGKRVSSGKSRELNRTTSKRWQLICSTYDDWRTLVENMSGSSNKCEKDLVKLIEQNFLQTIKMMCLDKEKHMQKRGSSRLKDMKAGIGAKETAISIRETRSLRGCANSIQQEGTKSSEVEAERKVQELERTRLKEERALRHQLREKRLSLLAPNDSPTSSLVGNRNAGENEPISVLCSVLKLIKQHEAAWPFVEAVDERYAPCYYDIIKTPMDLTRIESKLKSGEYDNVQCVLDDVNLMIDNSRTYNGPDNEYTALARTLRDHFIRLLNQYGLLLADCLTTPEMFSVPVPNSGVEASPGSPANSDASQSSESTLPVHSPCNAVGVQSPDRASTSSADTVPYMTTDTDMLNPDLSDDAEIIEDPSSSCSDIVSTKLPLNEEPNDTVPTPTECSSVLPHPVFNVPTVDCSIPQSVVSSLPSLTTDTSFSVMTTSVTNTTASSNATYYPLPGKFRFRNVGNATAEDNMLRSHASLTAAAATMSPEMKTRASEHNGAPVSMTFKDSKTETITNLHGATSKVVCKAEVSEQWTGPVDFSRHVTSSIISVGAQGMNGRDVEVTRNSKVSGGKLTTVCASPKSHMSVGEYGFLNKAETGSHQPMRHFSQLCKSESNSNRENANLAKTACASSNRVCDLKAVQGSFVARNGATENHKINNVGKSNVQENRITHDNVSAPDERDNVSNTVNSAWQTRLDKLQACHSTVKRKFDVVNSSVSNGVGHTAMNNLDRIPLSAANSVPNGTTTDFGLHKFNLLPNGGTFTGPPVAYPPLNGTPLGGFGSLSSNSFGSHPHGASARSVRPLPPQNIPRIDSMLMGLPIISGIAPSGLPWPPRLVSSVQPINHSFLPTESSTHIHAGSHVRPVAQAALDYVSHLRPNCGLSPLAIHSPRSMSPRIPQPSCRSTLISPVPPTSRLSISIPPPSPTPGTEYQRQPLGDGILTTQPPGSLFITNARTVVANGRSALPVGSLVGSAMFQWPQQPPIIHFGW